ncbi:sugar transporter SWEET1-like isoform X2 [Leptotrombidium deliense]|uniref:Sugar transporter SWEET1 n=1 Tax=Leptotrombidium deliense TaxID=299467 RepID=A0A443S7I8_9ACAR|nr:sugar transporter SWEET1-like isoform X2 [Leptotrombidium deliense]
MNMVSELNFVPIIANVAIFFTIISFLSGLEICVNVWKKRSTNDISCVPLLAGFISTTLWLRYSLYVNDIFMMVCNVVGATCFTSYVMGLNRKLCFAITTLVTVVFITKKSENPSYYSGLCASLFGVLFTLSPLASIVDVFKNRSTAKLPFYIILSSFVVTLLWFIYGMLINDTFVKVPNALSSVISGCQLLLFLIFPNTSMKKGKN